MEMRRLKFTLFLIIALLAIYYLFIGEKFKDKFENLAEHDQNNDVNSTFILESPPCGEIHNIIMLVTSYTGHVELRSAHRRAYSSLYLEKLGIKRVFLLAQIPSTDKSGISQKSIINENERFDDIIQGDFMEAYRNLTYKHLMGLRWAAEKCSLVNFVLKFDDDIVFNIHNLIHLMNDMKNVNDRNVIMGYVIRGMKPIRLKANKWYVTKAEFNKSYYPPFVSGWMYITTPTAARNLINIAKNMPYFWIDDVFVTGVLASKVNVKLIDLRYKNVFLEHFESLDCCLNDMIYKNITCEYSVGPNGNDDGMIVNFSNALDACHVKKCQIRPFDKPLNQTCVSVKKFLPLKKGNPVVNILKL